MSALLTACSVSVRPIYKEQEKKTAESAIEQLHERMNAEQYEAIYEDAHPQFKAITPKDEAIQAMRQTRERTGKIIQVTEHWVNYIMGDPVPVRAIYNIKGERGEFNEWIALVISENGERALITQYQIFPGSSPRPDIE
jgi:hypothetical protein